MKSREFRPLAVNQEIRQMFYRGKNTGWRCSRIRAVEEHSALAEAVPEGAVDDAVERMPV